MVPCTLLCLVVSAASCAHAAVPSGGGGPSGSAGPFLTASLAPVARATAPPGPAHPSSSPSPDPRVGSGSVPPEPIERALAPALQGQLAAAVATLKLPGAQAAVIFVGGGTWTGAAGYADVAARRPMTTRDLFDVGSITKTFLAAEVLRLAEEGVLRLDDPLARWLPTYPGATGISLRQLLSHTSGLSDYFWNERLLQALGRAPRQAWRPDQLLRYVARPIFAPGRGWRYSNTNYLLLGMVLEAATGRSLAAELRARFWGPLGLAHTTLQGDGPAPSPASLGPLTLPYERRGAAPGTLVSLADGSGYLPFTSLATALGAAGGLASRADDLARWGAALYGGHVLQAASLRAMEDVTISRRFKPQFVYGLGAQQLTVAGYLSYGHSGLCSGYRAALRYLPDFGASIAVLTNINGPDPDRVVARLVAVMAAASAARHGGAMRD